MTYAVDASPPFYHGTRADLRVGDLLAPGFNSNYGERKLSWIYFSGTLDAAIWGCELAKGDGRERIYVVEPTGAFFDDPNLTDKRFPGNPTESYRSREPLRIVGEVEQWEGHPPARLREMKDHLARMQAEGGAEIMIADPAVAAMNAMISSAQLNRYFFPLELANLGELGKVPSIGRLDGEPVTGRAHRDQCIVGEARPADRLKAESSSKLVENGAGHAPIGQVRDQQAVDGVELPLEPS